MSEQTGPETPDPNTPDTGDNGNTSNNDDAAGADVNPNPNQASETPQAPVPAEPAPVQVQPADQSDVKTDKVFDKDYEVTPDRGYRVAKPTVEDNPSEDASSDDS